MLLLLTVLSCPDARSQEKAVKTDSMPVLGQVLVRGFGTNRPRIMVPASVSYLGQRDLQRYSNTSLVPALNTVPGVRMEERSPGSYRLSIRGSLLRSPFGVRNVKVYHDDFILTDAGGNTYVNLLDINAIGSVEIIKGPAGSIYGTGTGGVVNFSSPEFRGGSDSSKRTNERHLQFTGGSYGQFSEQFRWVSSGKKVDWQISQGHFRSDGYRQNSRMSRDHLQADIRMKAGKRDRLASFIMLSGLSYRTPGGLTLAQAAADPRQARPATATLPSAAAQKAGVRNRSVLIGIANEHAFSEAWKMTTALTGMYTDFENPFISNYEKRRETNIGIRMKFAYDGHIGNTGLKWVSGLEWQTGRYRIDSTGNKGGEPYGDLARDEVKALQRFLFTQAEFQLTPEFLVQTGISLNGFRYELERVIGKPATGPVSVAFRPQAAPRLAILYLAGNSVSLHASVTRGFSPPSVAEVRPSAGGFSPDLQAESGWSSETGVKGSVLRGRLQFDLALFRFDLRNAIVRRTNAAGSEYFINAGSTRQQGIECFIQGYPVRSLEDGIVRDLRMWVSATLSDFTFGQYTVNNTSYEGNRLTGVPQKVIVAGTDIRLAGGFSINLTYNHTDRLPLTDANDAFAEASGIWQIRAGWQRVRTGIMPELFAGADNLGDAYYSLGNDLNAFGKRYYNPAPGRNFFAGVKVRF